MRIRTATEADLPVMREIERAAGTAFAEVGMREIADAEPLSLEELASYQQGGRAWVAEDSAGRPVAYLVADLVDGDVHVEQVSVHPGAARRGIGRTLLDHAAAYAAARGASALTLTTFAEVPWNAPYYVRCGFPSSPTLNSPPPCAPSGTARWPTACTTGRASPCGAP
jgi:GNAT superfamily N-acetyltransferase